MMYAILRFAEEADGVATGALVSSHRSVETLARAVRRYDPLHDKSIRVGALVAGSKRRGWVTQSNMVRILTDVASVVDLSQNDTERFLMMRY